MSRRTVLRVILLFVLCAPAGAADSTEDAFAPHYDGAHVLPRLHLPEQQGKMEWGATFWDDTKTILMRYGWYLAELVCLVDETGQVRDVVLTETMPSRNLSMTIVSELRRHKLVAARGPAGPVPSIYPFRLVYVLQNKTGDLGANAARLRDAASKGNARARYVLSRMMRANVSLRKSDLDFDTLLQSAAEGGEPSAMLALGVMAESGAGGTPTATLAEQRRWLLKAANAGSGAAQVLVALDSWAEQTEDGYARARHWLELATRAKDPNAPKYLAALLVSHSKSSADWKKARELAIAASKDWHDKTDPDVWQVRAAATALTGDFRAALEAQNKARELASRAGWPTEALDRRLAAYGESRTVTDEIVVIPAVAHSITAAKSEAQPQ